MVDRELSIIIYKSYLLWNQPRENKNNSLIGMNNSIYNIISFSFSTIKISYLVVKSLTNFIKKWVGFSRPRQVHSAAPITKKKSRDFREKSIFFIIFTTTITKSGIFKIHISSLRLKDYYKSKSNNRLSYPSKPKILKMSCKIACDSWTLKNSGLKKVI